jgi:Bax protein
MLNKTIKATSLAILLLVTGQAEVSLAKAAAKPAKKMTESHAQFVQTMLNNANDINNKIATDRTKLLSLDRKYHQTHNLSAEDKQWLATLATTFKVKGDLSQESTWTEFKKRVDVIPTSLVLGQTIQESGWGSSYLARDAHNYFGQECGSSKTCYKQTNYRYFKNSHEAVFAYMKNLDSNNAYRKMREIRYQQRQQDKKPTSLAMVDGLRSYSILHEGYIAMIKKVIRTNHLEQYDHQYV